MSFKSFEIIIEVESVHDLSEILNELWTNAIACKYSVFKYAGVCNSSNSECRCKILDDTTLYRIRELDLSIVVLVGLQFAQNLFILTFSYCFYT